MKNKKITLIDILIVLLVIAAVIVAVGVFKPGATGGTKKVTYVVLAADQLPETAQYVVKADKVMLDTAENAYGKVLSAEMKPAELTRFSPAGGKYVEQTTEERVDLYITVEAEAVENDWGYTIGSQNIRIGETQNIGGPGYGVTGYIIDIQD